MRERDRAKIPITTAGGRRAAATANTGNAFGNLSPKSAKIVANPSRNAMRM